MLRDGLALVYASCSDFFDSAGETQRWVIVARDAVGIGGTLATSAMALHHASSSAVSNLALVTAASFAGLDLYTKNFLFAAENVDSVRTLIANALSVHQQAILTKSPFTYQTATNLLQDNQAICSPMRIAALAREAIKKGTVVASPDPASDLVTLPQTQDRNALLSLGQILNPPGALTADQAGALWWLLKDSSTADERAKIIAPKLKGLPAASNPLDSNGAYKPDWTLAGRVSAELDRFSEQTKAQFRNAIASARKGGTQAGNENFGGATGVPVFSTFAPARTTVSPHVSIGIR